MTLYVRHDLDGRWHVLESVQLGASVVTRCRGRWPQTDAIRIADRAEPGLACGGCEPAIRFDPCDLDTPAAPRIEDVAVEVDDDGWIDRGGDEA